jgi:hypothetical protein
MDDLVGIAGENSSNFQSCRMSLKQSITQIRRRSFSDLRFFDSYLTILSVLRQRVSSKK